MTTRVAIIGCGLIGSKRAGSLPAGAEVAAVYDVDATRAEQLAADAGGHALVARSAAEALDRADLAIVAVLHRDLPALALEAIQHDCHVLVEKPGARRPGELTALRDMAAVRGMVVRVGFNHRFHPSIRKARALLTERDLGGLLYVRGRYGHGGRIGYEREWRADPGLSGGGELLDQGVHLIDLLRHLEGDVDLVFSELTSVYWEMPVEDNAFLCLRGRTGGTAWLHASWTEWKNLFSLEIAHRHAKIEITGLGGSYGTERLVFYEMRPKMGPPDTTAWEWPGPDESWTAELVDVLSSLNGAPAEGADLDDAIAALQIVEEAYRLSPTSFSEEP